MMKVLVLVTAVGAATAFGPSFTTTTTTRLSLLRSSPENNEASVPTDETAVPTSYATDISAATPAAALYGWVPDDTKPCYGLPGAVAPTGYFDPLGFCQAGISLNDVKRYREAEVQHGRVAMRKCGLFFVCVFRF
jgi:hypothetical protein